MYRVPQVDLAKAHDDIADVIVAKISSLIAIGRFNGGTEVEQFEADFAQFCSAKFCVGTASGTDSLTLSLRALEIGSGDEVIVPALTFAATAEAVIHVGATPVFVDILDNTCTLDPAAFAAAIGSRTKAVIPVHLYGHPAQMDKICKLADDNSVYVIEDAAQAAGAQFRGKPIGGIGNIGAFSFFPTKNLGAIGEAGAVVGNDREMMNRIKALKNHGQYSKNIHELIGYNSRLDSIQAAVLRTKLKALKEKNDTRSRIAKIYDSRLKHLSESIRLPVTEEHCTHVWHQYVIRCKERGRIIDELSENGIECGIHYPCALHQQSAFQSLMKVPSQLNTTETIVDEIISLPIFPEMSEEQIEYVVDTISNII